MNPVHRATPGRRTVRIAALVAIAAVALAACSSAATPAPTLPSIAPVTPTPVATPAPTPDPNASASPDLSACPKAATDITPLKKGETKTVTLDTSAGKIVTEVSGDLAPVAAGNFVDLAQCGYYDGVVFHRSVPGFVIQAGDGQFARVPIESPDHMGYGGPGYSFADEPVVGEYVRGTLAMANSGPDTNGSQFFIVLDDLTGKLDKAYTIFGKVTEGMDVVDKIAAAPNSPADANGNTPPVDPVVINTATVAQ